MLFIQRLIVKIILFTIIAGNGILLGQVFFERANLSKRRVFVHLLMLLGVFIVFGYKGDEIHFPCIAGTVMLIVTNMVFKGKVSYKVWAYIMLIDVVYTCNLLSSLSMHDVFHIIEAHEYEGWLVAWGISTLLVIMVIKVFQGLPFYNKEEYPNYPLKKNMFLSGIGIIYFSIIFSVEYTIEKQVVTKSVLPLLVVYVVAIGGLWCTLMSYHRMMMTYEEKESKLQKRFFKKHLTTYVQINKLKRAQEAFEAEANQTISDLLKHISKDKLEELQPIIRKIEARRERCNPYIITGNSMLDMLINEKYDRACKRNIEMKVNISLPEKVGMGTIELCMLLDQTLDYALEQCEHISEEREKSISIEGVWYKGYVMFKLYYTTPEGKIEKYSSERLIRHAAMQDPYGLGTIVKHIRKYEGEMSLQACGWGEEKLTFSINAA